MPLRPMKNCVYNNAPWFAPQKVPRVGRCGMTFVVRLCRGPLPASYSYVGGSRKLIKPIYTTSDSCQRPLLRYKVWLRYILVRSLTPLNNAKHTICEASSINNVRVYCAGRYTYGLETAVNEWAQIVWCLCSLLLPWRYLEAIASLQSNYCTSNYVHATYSAS